MNRSRTVIGGTILLLAGMALGWAIHSFVLPSATSADEEAEPVEAVGDMHVSVTTTPATVGDLAIVLVAPGVVQAEPAAEHQLTSRAAGRVIETLAAQGQRVKQGDVLLRFDEVPLQAALAQARASFAVAANQLAEFEGSGRESRRAELEAAAQRSASQLTLLEAQASRLEPLNHDGLVADRALTEARQAVEQARLDRKLADLAVSAYAKSGASLQNATLVAAREAAEANVHEAERVLAEAVVRAPCAGQIVEFTARPGARIEVGALFGRLLADEGRVIAFTAAASAAHDLRIGAQVSWEGLAHGAQSGSVVRIGGSIDPASGLFEIVVAPAPGMAESMVGLHVRGEIELRRITGAVLVPEHSVLRADDRQVVVLALDGQAKVVPVEVLGRHNGLAAVRGDVQAGSHVIVDGGYNLPDGAHVVEIAR